MIRKWSFAFLPLLIWALATSAALAQTTAFTYQGRLTDAGSPANGNYDLQFKLFDMLMGGTQQGATLVRNPVVASDGVFTVMLDFGANVFTGASRFLEIGVRPSGSGSAYIILAPRQPVLSSPYAIQTLNATQLGGVDASQYVTTTNGGTSFIRNAATQQASANFNISGNGVIGSSLGVGTQIPLGRLHLHHPGNVAAMYFSTGSGTEGPATFRLQADSGLFGQGRSFVIYDDVAAQYRLVINGSGNIGIGTAAPAARLSVEAGSGFGVASTSSGTNGISIFGSNTGGGLAGRFDGNVAIFGKLSLSLGAAGNTPLCRNIVNEIASCSSSLRYKTQVQPFSAGLTLVRRLRPVSFKWKTDGATDLGLIAEEVATIEPLLVTRNQQGEIEGVKYDHLNIVLINAVREQQTQLTQLQQQLARQQQRNTQQQEQLKQQQTQIETLKNLLCLDHPQASICK